MQRTRHGKWTANAAPEAGGRGIGIEELSRALGLPGGGGRDRAVEQRSSGAQGLPARDPTAPVPDGQRADRAGLDPRLDLICRSTRCSREIRRGKGLRKRLSRWSSHGRLANALATLGKMTAVVRGRSSSKCGPFQGSPAGRRDCRPLPLSPRLGSCGPTHRPQISA